MVSEGGVKLVRGSFLEKQKIFSDGHLFQETVTDRFPQTNANTAQIKQSLQ